MVRWYCIVFYQFDSIWFFNEFIVLMIIVAYYCSCFYHYYCYFVLLSRLLMSFFFLRGDQSYLDDLWCDYRGCDFMFHSDLFTVYIYILAWFGRNISPSKLQLPSEPTSFICKGVIMQVFMASSLHCSIFWGPKVWYISRIFRHPRDPNTSEGRCFR